MTPTAVPEQHECQRTITFGTLLVVVGALAAAVVGAAIVG
jgi:hypothetical protein